MTLIMKPLAILLVLIGTVMVGLKFAWDSYGWLVPIVAIGLPALMWAAVYGCPS